MSQIMHTPEVRKWSTGDLESGEWDSGNSYRSRKVFSGIQM